MLVFPVWKAREFTPSDDLCFVLMPFQRRAVVRVYKEYVCPVLRELGLKPRTAAEFHGTDVVEDIWRRLNEARIVVADLTGKSANVMYELGVAHALGKPAVLLSADPGKTIPFDISRFRHILYKRSPVSKLQKMQEELRLHVEELLEENPTSSRLLGYIHDSAETWVSRYHDSLALAPEGFLNLARLHADPGTLSGLEVAFCLATAAHYGSVDNMVYWGRYCARLPEAAHQIAFVVAKKLRRPRYRIAKLVEQFPSSSKARALRTILQQGDRVKKGLVTAIRKGTVTSYVSRNQGRDLDKPLRNVLLEEFKDIVI
jgi:hypothetical protein